MKKILLHFFCIFHPLFCMEDTEKTEKIINRLKPFLESKELHLDEELIEQIKKNNTSSNISIIKECITHLIQTNNNNAHSLDYLVPILFNEKTINERIETNTIMDLLALDTNAFNSALYKIRGSKNITTIQPYNLIFKMSDCLNKQYILLTSPLENDHNFTDFIRINGKNFVTNDTIKNDNQADHTQPDKIEYWKSSLLPHFTSKIIPHDDVCFYKLKIIYLLCCLEEKKKQKKIVIPKQIVNHHIIPYIDKDIFITQSNIVYNDMQKLIKKIKTAERYALEKFGSELYSFLLNHFKPWHKKEKEKLVCFNNVKKLFEYHK